MLKQTAAAVLACSVLVAAGCSSDDDDDQDTGMGTTDPGTTDPGTTDPGTTDPGTTDPGTTDPGTTDPVAGSDTGTTFEISISNDTVGQFMTPPVVVIHDPEESFYEIGDESSVELQAIAEDGNNAPFVALAESLDTVSASGVAFVDAANPGPSITGDIATVTLVTDEPTDVFTAVSMIICSNDGFSGLNSVALPTEAAPITTFQATAFDAGTEVNILEDEVDNVIADYWPSPPCAGNGENLHDDEFGVVAIHPGQTAAQVGEALAFTGEDTIMTVTITRMAGPEGVEEPVDPEPPATGGGTVAENAGTAEAALESPGTFTSFLAATSEIGVQSYDTNVWTVFAPTDAAVADATVDVQNHIFVGGALTAAQLLDAGTVTTNAGVTYAVTGTEAELLVDGNATSLLATGDSGAQVYTIDGVLGATPAQ